METKICDGLLFESMIRAGLSNVIAHEHEINNLNVFPVPDGDTGTNIKLTLINGIDSAASGSSLKTYLKGFSEGMLIGARGNSGSILANFFGGFQQSLARYDSVSAKGMIAALVYAYRAAYKGCRHPQEGTMLTVAREGVETVRSQIGRGTSFEIALGMYVAAMKTSLASTPELLPCLKEAGVVDSGGQGLIYLFEGMLKYLQGGLYENFASPEKPESGNVKTDTSLFNEKSKFEFGYCMEFLLQLMDRSNYERLESADALAAELEKNGSSIVINSAGTRIKVHIHTFVPEVIIKISRKYGEFVTFKLENMCVQHSQTAKEKSDYKLCVKPFYTLVIASGEKQCGLLRDCGADIVIDGGRTMNTSTGEILDGINAVKAVNPEGQLLVFPNNKNIFAACEAAIKLSGFENARIVESPSVISCYIALSFDNPNKAPFERRKILTDACGEVSYMCVSKASKDYNSGRLSVKEGEFVAYLGGVPRASASDNPVDAIIKAIPEEAEFETCIAFAGKGSELYNEKLEQRLGKRLPDTEIVILEAGQENDIYSLGFI